MAGKFDEKFQMMKNSSSWFNDEVMNSFFGLLSERYPAVGFLSSFFAHSNSRQWTLTQRTVSAFESGQVKRILVPFHTPGHWTALLVAWDGVSAPRSGIYSVMDSLGEPCEPLVVKEWLGKTFPTWRWRFVVPFAATHQHDSVNCGAYSCLYAELAAQGRTLQEIDERCRSLDIRTYRNKILADLEEDSRRKEGKGEEKKMPESRKRDREWENKGAQRGGPTVLLPPLPLL